jgi:hypothetical protein
VKTTWNRRSNPGTTLVLAGGVRAIGRTLLLGLFVACLTGCAGRVPGAAPACWVKHLGGRETGASELRLARVSRAVLPDYVKARMTVAVLCCAEPAAYSWPSGEIFVTRGLLDLLDDDEQLAAAIAHEAGHLMTDPGHAHRHGIVSLRGGGGGKPDSGLHAEYDADRAGTQLLRAAGMNPRSMTAMLRKVRDAATLAPRYRHDMTRRIERLEQDAARRHP